MSPLIDVEASWQTLMVEADYVQQVHGFAAQKTRDDLERYRLVIEASKPELVIETGSRYGGSALWFAGQGLDVITVDVDGSNSAPARERAPGHLVDRIAWVFGDSTDRHVAGLVASLVAGRRCMVSLDSEHAAPHVAAEIEAYGPLVSPGCYLVVEDGLADLVSPERAVRFGRRIPDEGGPAAAAERCLAGSPLWLRDEVIESWSEVSHHPLGWWRRHA